jgi:hypothetical protein
MPQEEALNSIKALHLTALQAAGDRQCVMLTFYQ